MDRLRCRKNLPYQPEDAQRNPASGGEAGRNRASWTGV